jgi:hypothetical protein
MSTKLHQLLSKWPSGAVRAVSSLKKEGYSAGLLCQYRQSGWLTSLGDNAVYRTGDTISPLGGLYALQHDLHLSVHVGGRSALELQGLAHYLRNNRAELTLFGHEARLPKWFLSYDWRQPVHYRACNMVPVEFTEGLLLREHQGFKVLIATPALAMFEYLSLVPKETSCEEGLEIMSGLTTLRPEKVQRLLEACTSIKVKRLFLLLAEECNHPWVKRLDIDSVELGVGPRNLIEGGKLHKKYKITVPESILSRRIS